MPECKVMASMLCLQTCQCAALLFFSGLGHLSVSLFCACWWRFSSACCACSWSCGFDTEALLSEKDSILQLQGSLSCLLCCCNFILGKFLSFPGDEALATFAQPEKLQKASCPVLLFRFLREWVWDKRIPSQGNYHYTAKIGPLAPPLSQFGEEWLLWCFYIGPFLQKLNKN